MSFSYNGGGDKDTDVEPSAPARLSTSDLEAVTQQRSDITAAGKPEKLGTEKALGRKRQR